MSDIKDYIDNQINETIKRAKDSERARLNPRDKSFDRFSSKDGLESFKLYTEPKKYLQQQRLQNEYENTDFSKLGIQKPVTFLEFINLFYKDAVLPIVYFDSLLLQFRFNYNIDSLNYLWPHLISLDLFCELAKTFYLDEDGEPIFSELSLTPNEITSPKTNPILKFLLKFNCFLFRDDEVGDAGDKVTVFIEALGFVGIYSKFDKNILEKNNWLLQKSTYMNVLGTLKTNKGFIKAGIDKSSNPDYFITRLSQLNNQG